MKATVYFSNLSECKEYASNRGVLIAVERMKQQYPEAVDIRDAIDVEDYMQWHKSNPWVAYCLVKPYKEGWLIMREFSVKSR